PRYGHRDLGAGPARPPGQSRHGAHRSGLGHARRGRGPRRQHHHSARAAGIRPCGEAGRADREKVRHSPARGEGRGEGHRDAQRESSRHRAAAQGRAPHAQARRIDQGREQQGSRAPPAREEVQGARAARRPQEMTRRVVLAGSVRTPIGNFGGALAASSAVELGTAAARAALQRAKVDPARVQEVVVGHARMAGNGPNVARQIGWHAGVPESSPAYTIHKACASGLQAAVSAAQSILLGDVDIALAGGTEHMTSVPFLALDVRWGKKLGDEALVDAMYRDGYLCPLCNQLMGETSETLATEYSIPREEQDEYALASHQRAARAWDEGRYAHEVVPVEIGAGKRAVRVQP